MKSRIRRVIYHSLRITGLLDLQRRSRIARDRGTAMILVFHGVTPDHPEDGVTISPTRFAAILRMLESAYQVLSLHEVLDRIRTGTGFRGREVAITFDDGYLDNYAHAAPLLEEYDFPACFFLTAGYVGTDRTFPWDREKGRESHLMSWPQARELAEMGFDIGCHTWSHPDLGREPVGSSHRELHDARNKIADEVGRTVEFFAYPFGNYQHITEEWIEAIRSAGFACNCSAVNRHVTRHSDPYFLPRLGAAPQRTVTDLRIDIDQPW